MIRPTASVILIAWLALAGMSLTQTTKDRQIKKYGKPYLSCRDLSCSNRSAKGFAYPKAGQLVYDGVQHGACVGCYQDIYLYLNRLTLQVPRAWDKEKTVAAATIQSQFRKAAITALHAYTSALPAGWVDVSDTVCRSYVHGPSLVLERPYFDDVTYCMRLLREDADDFKIHWVFPTPAKPNDSQLIYVDITNLHFDAQLRAAVSVTLNGNSAYREATPDELSHYQKVLTNIANKTKAQMLNGLKGLGWLVSDDMTDTYVAPPGLSLPEKPE